MKMTKTSEKDRAAPASDRAFRKAVKASGMLASAARLMRDAAADTATTADGHYDYLHWASQIEELLSSDDGEAGIGPTLQKMAESTARNRRTEG